jgi:hypothetical protein
VDYRTLIKEAAASAGDELATNVANRKSLGYSEAYGRRHHFVALHRTGKVLVTPAPSIYDPAPPIPPEPPAPPATRRAFGVWNGTEIKHGSLEAIADRVRALCPEPDACDLEWYPKAGEVSWQATFDGHPLAISHAQELGAHHARMSELGVRLVPYVVIRGRPHWWQAERDLIRACVDYSGACILNLEPPSIPPHGGYYWNGPTDEQGVRDWIGGLDLPPEVLWLCPIPRRWVVNTLGGPAVMRAWMEGCAGASWQTYEDAPAPDLAPDVAMPLVDEWAPNDSPWYRVCVVQQSMVERYWHHPRMQLAMQVWYLDGSLH